MVTMVSGKYVLEARLQRVERAVSLVYVVLLLVGAMMWMSRGAPLQLVPAGETPPPPPPPPPPTPTPSRMLPHRV